MYDYLLFLVLSVKLKLERKKLHIFRVVYKQPNKMCFLYICSSLSFLFLVLLVFSTFTINFANLRRKKSYLWLAYCTLDNKVISGKIV